MKLGRLPAKFDPNVRKLRDLALAPPPPVELRFQQVGSWPMYANDSVGDCTIAAVGHVIEYWNVVGKTGKPNPANSQVLAVYEQLSGYVPGDEATDTGLNELDVLNWWKANGMPSGCDTIKLTDFLATPAHDLTQLKQSIHNLGSAYLGYDMPSNAIQTTLWDVKPGAEIVGGHAIPAVGYDDNKGLIYVVSWGAVVPVTYAFHQKYCEEAWSCYSDDWIAAS